MTLRGFLFSFIMWLILAVLAILNGLIREFGVKKLIGEPWANHISVATGIIIIFFATYLFFKIFKSIFRLKDAILIGICWVILTVAFEFLFGHYVTGHNWEELLAQYNVMDGNLWPLALLAIGLSPWAAYRLVK
jgi:hypothetical protein